MSKKSSKKQFVNYDRIREQREKDSKRVEEKELQRKKEKEIVSNVILEKSEFEEILNDYTFGKGFETKFNHLEKDVRETYDKSFDFTSNGKGKLTYDSSKMEEEVEKIFELIKSDYKKLTEFVGLLNQRLWGWYYKSKENGFITETFFSEKMGRTYDKLWKKYDSWCINNLKGNKLNYYFKKLD